MKNPWVVVALAGVVLALVALPRTPLAAQADVVRQDDLAYATRGDRLLKLDIAAPAGGEGPFPAIVYIIDDWAHQDPNLDRKSLYYDLPEAAKRGYVAVAIDRRLITITRENAVTWQFPAELQDVKSAVRWLRAHAAQYRIDPDRLGAIGFSSGAWLALLVGMTGPTDGLEPGSDDLSVSSRVQAVVNIGGPTDLADCWNGGGVKAKLEDLLGGTPREVPQRYQQASPLGYVRADNPPVLTVHGDQDVLVPFSEAQALDEKMKAAGAAHTLLVRRGLGHANYLRDVVARKAVFEFLDRWLKKP